MSLLGTLAKVAVGVALAKGVDTVMKNSQGGGTMAGGQGGLGGLEDMMKSVLGGGQQGAGTTQAGMGGSGGLGGILDQLGGQMGGGQTGQAGGLGGLLGQLTQGGGLGDLLGGLAGGAAAGGAAQAGGAPDFGAMLDRSIRTQAEPDVPPAPEQEEMAGVMLRAMIQAAKSDGAIDQAEKAKLMEHLQGADASDMAFVQAALDAPVDVEGLARDVPQGMEAQVYTMSLMAIALDNPNEARYLHALGHALGLDHHVTEQIHAKLGIPATRH